MASYLTNRSQAVTIGDTLSEKQILMYDVPQGFVHGPLLFIKYTTSLGKIIGTFRPLKHCLHADARHIYSSLTTDTTPQILQTLEDCLEAIQRWMSAHKYR